MDGDEFVNVNGDAKIVAFTDSGILKIEASGKLLDQQRTLEATVDLRDRDHYPINAGIEFTDADIGPYLGLIAPEFSDIKGKATGTIKLSGPLSETDRIQAVARLTKLELGGAISERQTYKIVNQGDILLTATTREVAQAILEPLGADVRLAASAAEALSLLARDRPDVLVADIEMPGQDGYFLIHSVRALPAL